MPIAKEAAKARSLQLDNRTAIVYSIILPDRTAIILKLPNSDRLRSYFAPMGAMEMQQEVSRLRSLLEKRSTDEYLPQARKIYAALVNPLEADLAAAQTQTLVFIQDDVLRKIPAAALHDGRQFLVEKYAIATTPSLSLTAGSRVEHRNLEALILGLSEARPPFEALTNVKAETDNAQKILGGTKLLDRARCRTSASN